MVVKTAHTSQGLSCIDGKAVTRNDSFWQIFDDAKECVEQPVKEKKVLEISISKHMPAGILEVEVAE